jgi:hypothetical protein
MELFVTVLFLSCLDHVTKNCLLGITIEVLRSQSYITLWLSHIPQSYFWGNVVIDYVACPCYCPYMVYLLCALVKLVSLANQEGCKLSWRAGLLLYKAHHFG